MHFPQAPVRRMEYTSKCPLPLLPSKCLYHIVHVKSLCTCQVATANIMNECIHHTKPYLERSEIGIKPIAPHTKHMLWLPTMEAQDTL